MIHIIMQYGLFEQNLKITQIILKNLGNASRLKMFKLVFLGETIWNKNPDVFVLEKNPDLLSLVKMEKKSLKTTGFF